MITKHEAFKKAQEFLRQKTDSIKVEAETETPTEAEREANLERWRAITDPSKDKSQD
jgi:hypothetical protein